jgi:hypothetical protein
MNLHAEHFFPRWRFGGMAARHHMHIQAAFLEQGQQGDDLPLGPAIIVHNKNFENHYDTNRLCHSISLAIAMREWMHYSEGSRLGNIA